MTRSRTRPRHTAGPFALAGTEPDEIDTLGISPALAVPRDSGFRPVGTV
ncbi:hypothetical protein [Nocardia brasiliensis]|nr:hypothetical protein [Nocardia brasiliensis]